MRPRQPTAVAILLTREQAADVCQISLPTFDEWSRRAGFPVIRVGRTVRFPRVQLEEWLARTALATNATPSAPRLPTVMSVVSGRTRARGAS